MAKHGLKVKINQKVQFLPLFTAFCLFLAFFPQLFQKSTLF